jgi:hypothetical protein
MRAAVSLSLVAVFGASLILSGCASGGNAGFCGPLLDDTEIAAVAFNPVVPGMDVTAHVQDRLELVEKLSPAADLADELETWKAYLEKVVDVTDEDLSGAFDAYHDDPAVEKAGTALRDYYTDVCLR